MTRALPATVAAVFLYLLLVLPDHPGALLSRCPAASPVMPPIPTAM